MAATLQLRTDALTEHRVREDLTSDRKLAAAAGLTPSTVHRLLSGATKNPSSVVVASLVDAFTNLTLDDLWQRVPTQRDAA